MLKYLRFIKEESRTFKRIKQDGPTCFIYGFVNGLKFVSDNKYSDKSLSNLATDILFFSKEENHYSYVGEFFDSSIAAKALTNFYSKSKKEKTFLASKCNISVKVLDNDLIKSVNNLKSNEFILVQVMRKHNYFVNSHWLCIVQPKFNKHYFIDSASATPLIKGDFDLLRLEKIKMQNLKLKGKIFNWILWKKMWRNRKYSKLDIPNEKYEFKYVQPIKITVSN